MIYNDSNRKEKAVELACQAPCFVDSIEWKLAQIYEGDELTLQLERNIRELTRLLCLSVGEYQKTDGKLVCDERLRYQLDMINSVICH